MGKGNRSSVPMIDDHFPVTISTVKTNDMFTIDIDTKPNANRRIIYGVNIFTTPSAVPKILRQAEHLIWNSVLIYEFFFFKNYYYFCQGHTCDTLEIYVVEYVCYAHSNICVKWK